jgi:hypothetical protein
MALRRCYLQIVALTLRSAFGTLALSFWPYMIPFVITVDQVAALGWRRRLPVDAALYAHQLPASSGARSRKRPDTDPIEFQAAPGEGAEAPGAGFAIAVVLDERSVDAAIYDSGITPGALSGHFAMVASSTFRCWATNAGGVCVSQFDRETSS